MTAIESPAHSSVAKEPPKPPITAEVYVNGTWQKVTIVEKESEYLYKVHYGGTSDSADEWVAVTQIKNIDSLAVPSLPKDAIMLTSVATCSFVPPVAPVSNAERFSEQVAKRKIYEFLTPELGKRRIGVTYLFFQSGQSYSNTVSVSPKQALVFKNPSAPAGAMVYPVRAKYRLCEQVDGKTTSQIIDGNFSCYRNSKGFWECKTD